MSDLYVPCEKCGTNGQIYAYTNRDDPSSGEYFDCPLCHGTGEVDKELIENE